MSNTAISEATMRGVLEQLPHMSGQIVDGTRHEKVLSYMRLFLASDAAVEQLMSWNALRTLAECLQPQSDMRVTATAVRFLGDAFRARNGKVLWTAVHATQIVEWVVDNADSPHALVRVAWLHFMCQASYINDHAYAELLDRVDYPRLLLRRLLDSSYFVVASACMLLGRLFHVNTIDPNLSALIEQLVGRPFALQTSARKAAVLATAQTLLLLKNKDVQVFVHRVFAQPVLEPYLYDVDRLVRDRALDVLELVVLDVDAMGVRELVAALARRVDGCVVLRCLAAVVKQLPWNRCIEKGEARRLGLMIANMGVSLLLSIHPAVDGSDVDTVQTQLTSSDVDSTEAPITSSDVDSIQTPITSSDVDSIQTQVAKAAQQSPSASSMIACEAARIVREHSQTTFSAHTASSMCLLLSNPRVQQHTQLVQLVLSTLLQTLRLAHNRTHVQMVPRLICTFAIRAPGLRGVFDLALELLGSCNAEFVQGLEHAIRTRIVDVEWEARDTVLEFVTRAVREHAWPRVELLVTQQVVDDAVRALSDAEEYVRASAAYLLAAVVERGDEERARYVSEHKHLTQSDLARLVADSEAFVKRAALDLVHALGTRGVGMWIECLTYRTLYDLADDPDFEVRVRCARILALLTQTSPVNTSELQSTSLLLEMCRDSSRYVRAECLRSLRELKQNTPDVDMTNEPEPKRVYVGERTDLWEKLRNVDLAQLEASLSAEHLYQEALDTQVARELMREKSDANAGNNILDCY
ncbi:hypothetical protein GGH98_002295 [Coemansia sp. RSA 454]|nr:hypothetical protein GGH98_002295 [Coemansia sp. RSA 454]